MDGVGWIFLFRGVVDKGKTIWQDSEGIWREIDFLNA